MIAHHERASLTLKTVSFSDPLLLPAAEPYIEMNALETRLKWVITTGMMDQRIKSAVHVKVLK